LHLADSDVEEYHRKQSPAHLCKEVTYTVLRILTFIKRLSGICHEALHHCFVVWTKPDIASLPASDADRPCQKQDRARGRKRALAKASDQPPSCGKTAFLRNLKTLISSREFREGSKKMFGMTKREPDLQIGWGSPSFLITRAIERKGVIFCCCYPPLVEVRPLELSLGCGSA
jgi:hypothetical protein